MLILYSYFRSSASYRVRIALNYKGIPYVQKNIHLVRNGGEQFSTEYQLINPQMLIPSLIDDSKTITQSLAIIEYLEERSPLPALLPIDTFARAQSRAIAQMIACDIHPLNNRRVLLYLENVFEVKNEQITQWIQHWIYTGLSAIEKIIMQNKLSGDFCLGNEVTMADMCLIPQIFNAQRFQCDLSKFPNLRRINENCLQLPYFQAAHPNHQPDVETT